MNDIAEIMYLRSMMSSGGDTWLAVALVSGILIALIFRPQTVRSPSLLMFAGLCLAASLVMPTLVQWLITIGPPGNSPYGNSSYGPSRNAGDGTLVLQLLRLVPLLIGPALQALAILLTFAALMPQRRLAGRVPSAHPNTPQPASGSSPQPAGTIPGGHVPVAMTAGPPEVPTASLAHGSPTTAPQPGTAPPDVGKPPGS